MKTKRHLGKVLIRVIVMIGTLSLVSCSHKTKNICGERIQFEKPEDMQFNSNEQILLCGDPKTPSWNKIPFDQAEFDLRAFLNDRGYYSPQFTYKDERLTVEAGKTSVSTEIKYEGAPLDFEKIRIRDVVGKGLTSSLLDSLQAWTLQRLKNLGYACPEVSIKAVQETGVITIKIDPGLKYTFQTPKVKDPLGIYPESYRRFDAFKSNQLFDSDLIKLSTSRAEQDGIVVSSQLTYECPKNHPISRGDFNTLAIDQKVIGGDKQLITIGAGASTEEIPIAQASWKSVRLDAFGSNLLVSLYGSQRDQRLEVTYTDYVFRYAPRLSLNPNLRFEHLNERSYQSTEFQVSVPFAYRADFESSFLQSSLGPGISRVYSKNKNLNAIARTFTSILGELNFMSHDFELHQSDPRSGTNLKFRAEMLSPGASINPIAGIFRFNGTHLYRLNPVEPQQWLLGVRYGLQTTATRIAPSDTSNLPAVYYQTLGGDSDLRGFGRKELDHGTIGAFSAAFFGAEVRYAKSLPLWMEPFVFYDIGSLGDEPFGLNGSVYYSPGLGLRFNTPFGAIRSTFAHGYAFNDASLDPKLKHFQLFLSFGKEF